MAKLTNAQLVQQLEASHQAYERLASECNSLRDECMVLRTVVASARTHYKALRDSIPRTQVHEPIRYTKQGVEYIKTFETVNGRRIATISQAH